MVRLDPKAWVGKTVGGIYRIQRHVASGGFADVYQAWHEELDTPVALKMRRPVQAGAKATDSQRARNDDYAFAHFKTEAVLGFRLRDPHVVRVLDFRLEATAEYLVMEWLEGQSLRDIQNGRPMYWRRAAELTAAASEAVASLHASGWFHRDIKPDNFMVVGEGGEERVVLIDLGLVRHRPLAEPIMSQLAAFPGRATRQSNSRSRLLSASRRCVHRSSGTGCPPTSRTSSCVRSAPIRRTDRPPRPSSDRSCAAI